MKRSITKTIIKTIALILAILMPFVSLGAVAFATPPVYTNSFVGELNEKVDYLASIEQPKVVVVGGSSVAFGVDGKMIEEYLGMPVVNFGLYAALGTKLMLDLSRHHIGAGDIVVLAPEMDAQTLSLYFSSESTLQAMDDDPTMLRYLRGDNILSVIGGLWKHATAKLSYLVGGKKLPDPEGVYNAKNFDAAGNLTYERPQNEMSIYYDPANRIDLSPEIIDTKFVDYVNEYIQYCKNKGATVYFGYCPMNKLALKEGTTSESISAFDNYLRSVIRCEFLGTMYSPDDPRAGYIVDAGYFYDTNFHMNDSGVARHTACLITDLMNALSTTNFTFAKPLPPMYDNALKFEPAELPSRDVRYYGTDENDRYFTYEMIEIEDFETGEKVPGGYRITGLTELGKTQTSLTLPLGADTYRVVELGEGFLEGGICETLTLPRGFEQFITDPSSAMVTFGENAFRGASSLRCLRVDVRFEATVMPPPSFDGVHSDFKVSVPKDTDYGIGYYWSERGVTFVYE